MFLQGLISVLYHLLQSNRGFQPWIYTNIKVYILNLKGPTSFIIQYIFSLYQGLDRGPSDTEADDTPNVPPCFPEAFCSELLKTNKKS